MNYSIGNHSQMQDLIQKQVIYKLLFRMRTVAPNEVVAGYDNLLVIKRVKLELKMAACVIRTEIYWICPR